MGLCFAEENDRDRWEVDTGRGYSDPHRGPGHHFPRRGVQVMEHFHLYWSW